MQLDILKMPSGFLKLVEMTLTIIIISVTQGVKYFSFVNEPRAIFCGGVLVMSLVVTPLLLITYLLGHAREMHKMPFEMLINAVLAAFMVSAGGLIIDTAIKLGDDSYAINSAARSAGGKAAGSLAIINGVIYGIDTFFAKPSMD